MNSFCCFLYYNLLGILVIEKGGTLSQAEQKKLKGIPAAPGLAHGKTALVSEIELEIPNYEIRKFEDEIQRMMDAIGKGQGELVEIKKEVEIRSEKNEGEIFEAHRMILEDVAKSITIPTLIVTGDNDRGAIVTPALGIEAVQLLEKGEFGHISAAGHCVRYEQYQPYLKMVELFLKRSIPA